jgi:hypothetical protein
MTAFGLLWQEGCVFKRLSYGDAVRLLGGQDSKIVSALDKVAGGVLLGGAAAGVPDMLGLFGAKAEAARLGHELVIPEVVRAA